MARNNMAQGISAGLAAIAMTFSTSAYAASTPRIDPLVSLSIFGTAASRDAVCAAGAQAAAASSAAAASAASVAAAGQVQPGNGCVLPIVDAPVAAVDVPVGAPIIAAPVAGGIGTLPLLLGLVALAGLAALALGGKNNNNNDGNLGPVSP